MAFRTWSSTDNVTKYLEQLYRHGTNDDIVNFVTKTKFYIAEKLDGTNVCKDENKSMYGRKLSIPVDAEDYLKTSLKDVKDADVSEVKRMIYKKLCGTGEMEQKMNHFAWNNTKLFLYGELVCQRRYNSKERGLYGGWAVFGAAISTNELDEKEADTLMVRLQACGFHVKLSDDELKLLACPVFDQCVIDAAIDTPNSLNHKDPYSQEFTFYDLVLKYKEYIMHGEVEGLVLTWGENSWENELIPKTSNFCQRTGILKWKGPQESQPAGIKRLELCLGYLQSKKEVGDTATERALTSNELFTLTAVIKDLIAVLSYQPPESTNTMKKRVRREQYAAQNAEKIAEAKVHAQDKQLIVQAIKSAKTKFDTSAMYFDFDKNKFIESFRYAIRVEAEKDFLEKKQLTELGSHKEFLDQVCEKILSREEDSLKKKAGKLGDLKGAEEAKRMLNDFYDICSK